MKIQTIYVLHEYGAPSHYNALVSLGKQEGFDVKFYEFSLYNLLKSVIKGKYSLHKWCLNILFLLTIPLKKRTKIVLGIAPFDYRITFLMFLLKRHEVYYHTSYTHWDGIIMAHPTKSSFIIQTWKKFTNNYTKHIFAVSQKTKEELIKYGFSHQSRISVVNHSYAEPIITDNIHLNTKTFIFVGRLVQEKGIEELLNIFSSRSDLKLIIVGDGVEKKLVEEYQEKYPNILYKGYVNTFKDITLLYKQASFVLMNSHRTETWEELFGIALIEGMACGCVPITTNHPGPKEIISNNENGFICKEGSIIEGIDKAINLSQEKYRQMRQKAIICAQQYISDKIASRWKEILK